jgi:hypothetical protein
MASAGSVTRLASAALLTAGGVTIAATVGIDYMLHFWLYIGVQGVGFTLTLAGALLAFGAFPRELAWGLFAAGSAGWFICWSWFLSFGLLIPIPIVFWAAVSSIAYLASTFVVGTSANSSSAMVTGALSVGSLLSTVVMAAVPTISSDFSYLPFGVGVAVGGILLAILTIRGERSSETSHPKR